MKASPTLPDIALSGLRRLQETLATDGSCGSVVILAPADRFRLQGAWEGRPWHAVTGLRVGTQQMANLPGFATACGLFRTLFPDGLSGACSWCRRMRPSFSRKRRGRNHNDPTRRPKELQVPRGARWVHTAEDRGGLRGRHAERDKRYRRRPAPEGSTPGRESGLSALLPARTRRR